MSNLWSKTLNMLLYIEHLGYCHVGKFLYQSEQCTGLIMYKMLSKLCCILIHVLDMRYHFTINMNLSKRLKCFILKLHTQSLKLFLLLSFLEILKICIKMCLHRSHDYILLYHFSKKSSFNNHLLEQTRMKKSQYFLMKCSFCIVGLRDRLKVYLKFFKNDM